MALAVARPVPAGIFGMPSSFAVLRGSAIWKLFAIQMNYQACVAGVRTSDLVCKFCLLLGSPGSRERRPIDGQLGGIMP